MKTYNANRTASEFIGGSNDGVEFKCWRGPVGDGKSVGCIMSIYVWSSGQRVSNVTEDGVKKRIRWSKWLIARHTHKALNETTIESWNEWLGDRTQWHNNNAWGRFEDVMPDGTILRIDLICHATESNNIMNDLQSLELSGAWVNEACQSPLKVIMRIHSRIGRFNPDPQSGRPLIHFPVIMDTNSPDETNWWYRKECVEKPEGWEFHVSPPALLARKDPTTGKVFYIPNRGEDFATLGIPPAENVREIDGGYHDGFGYWMKQVPGNDPDVIRTLLLNQFGTSVAGMPVYPEWVDSSHCVKGGIPYQRGMALILGSDLGRTPATVICQMGPNGVLYCLAEVTTWDDARGVLRRVDVGQFIDEYLKPVLVNSFGYPHCTLMNFADPAGKNYNEVVSVSAIDVFNRKGIRTVPCDKQGAGFSFEEHNANNITLRVRNVSENLRRTCGGVPAIQVSDACDMLRKGFNGKYCYRKMRTGGGSSEERYTEEPDKNDWSHVHDAFQYACLAAFKGGVDYSRPVDMIGRSVSYSEADLGFDTECV